MHQQGIGLQTFVANNHAYPSFIGPTNSDNPGWWINQISSGSFGITKPATNLIAEGVWVCPSAPSHLAFPYEKDVFSCYGYNVWGSLSQNRPSYTYDFTNALGLSGHLVSGTPIPGHWGFAPVEETEVAVPADMMAIGDSLLGGIRFDRLNMFTPTRTGLAMARPQGRVNVLFCDGHVESPSLHYVFDDTNDTALVRWNRDHRPHRESL